MPDADWLSEIVFAENPHLSGHDAFAVRDFAVAQIRAWRLAAWLESNGDFDSRGRPRPGLDPVSRAALRVDESLVLERGRQQTEGDLAEGRRLREAARQRLELGSGSA